MANQRALTVMVVEDDPLCIERMRLELAGASHGGFQIVPHFFHQAEAALAAWPQVNPDIVLLDIYLSHPREGLDCLPRFLGCRPEAPVLVHSVTDGYTTIVEAMRLGAFDFLPKHVDGNTLRSQLVASTLAFRKFRPLETIEEEADDARLSLMWGQSRAIKTLKDTIRRLRQSQGSVLIEGPSGTGKELVARAFARDGRPFVAVDSATLEHGMASSLLFGHERGAFTGADRAQSGLIEAADGGVLFLDEVANMSLEVQAKLLRVLEQREVMRLGSQVARPVCFRLIAATHASLAELCEQRAFRFDLLMRLQVFSLRVPSLGEREEDVVPLFCAFLARSGTQGAPPRRLGVGVAEHLTRRAWPGNVRQLAHAAEHAATMAGPSHTIELRHLPPFQAQAPLMERESRRSMSEANQQSTQTYAQKLRCFEYETLLTAYREAAGNVSRAARLLDMDRSVLHQRLCQHDIHQARKL